MFDYSVFCDWLNAVGCGLEEPRSFSIGRSLNVVIDIVIFFAGKKSLKKSPEGLHFLEMVLKAPSPGIIPGFFEL